MEFNKIDFSNKFFQPFIVEIEEEINGIMAQNSFLSQMKYEEILAFTEKGSRRESEEIYFKRRRNVVAMALYLQWEREKEVLRHFKNLVWDICQEYSWALPAHLSTNSCEITIDLFAAETAHMLAEFTEIFEADFEPLLLNEINKQIHRRVLTPFLEKAWNFEKLENNWSAVCAGAIGMTVLTLTLDLKEKEIILKRCFQAMDYFLKGYGDDGCCTEGISYWVYGFGFYLYFAETYERHQGISILKGKKIEAIASSPTKLQGKDGRFIMFSDAASTTHIPTSIRCFLKEKLSVSLVSDGKISSFHFDHCYRWAHLSRILSWSNPVSCSLQESDDISHFFADAQWLIFKNDALFFAAKGGHNDESHNHNDLGSFVFGVGNELTLVDFGAGAYSADYFGDKRYTYIQTRSNWHNVPTINNQEQMAGASYKATIEDVEFNENGCKFKLDLSAGYATDATVKRSFQLGAKQEQLVIIDEVIAKGYQANFVSYEKPTIEKGQILWTKLRLNYYPTLFESEIEEAVAINHFNHEEKVYALRLKAKKQCQHYKFIFRLI